jgi:hypothetical protein
MRWAGCVAHMGEVRNKYKVLVRKPERKRLLWKIRHGWKDNIIIYFKEVMCEIVDSIYLTQIP